jgi:hypothetical protein
VGLNVLITGFQLSGVLAVALLLWALRDTLTAPPGGDAPGGGWQDGGSDRVTPPWSWHGRHRPSGPRWGSPGTGGLRRSRPSAPTRR